MPHHDDMRLKIIQVSSELFMQSSYAAVSIKDIARAAGCTSAALYYHFDDGKPDILREAIDYCMPDLIALLDKLPSDAPSLQSLGQQVAQIMFEHGADMLRKTRWMIVEFPNLEPGEKADLHEQIITFQTRLADRIEPFVDSRRQAELLAWFLFSAVFGYGQLFYTLELLNTLGPLGMDYVNTVSEALAAFARSD